MLNRLKNIALSEFWYWRGEGLFIQFGVINDLIDKCPEGGYSYYKLMNRLEKIAGRMENADARFWYYSART